LSRIRQIKFVQIAEPFAGINGKAARCREKLIKERLLSQDIAPAGALFFEKNGSRKVERSFYFCKSGQKTEDFKEKARFSVEKKSLIFGADFRILKSKGGEKWGIQPLKWRKDP